METREQTRAGPKVGTRCTEYGFPRGRRSDEERRRGGDAHLFRGLMGVDALAVE